MFHSKMLPQTYLPGIVIFRFLFNQESPLKFQNLLFSRVLAPERTLLHMFFFLKWEGKPTSWTLPVPPSAASCSSVFHIALCFVVIVFFCIDGWREINGRFSACALREWKLEKEKSEMSLTGSDTRTANSTARRSHPGIRPGTLWLWGESTTLRKGGVALV